MEEIMKFLNRHKLEGVFIRRSLFFIIPILFPFFQNSPVTATNLMEEDKIEISSQKGEQKPPAIRSIYNGFISTIGYIAEPALKYIKMGIGFSRASWEFNMLGEEKLKLITSYPSLLTNKFEGRVVPLSLPEDFSLHQKLYQHVQTLSYQVGPRNFYKYPENLLKAKNYIKHALSSIPFKEQPMEVKPKEIFACLESNGYVLKRKSDKNPIYSYRGGDIFFKEVPDKYEFTNVIAEIKGTKAKEGQEDYLLTFIAHYDTVNDSPGADDNASGVAAALVLAEVFSQFKIENTLRFVFVHNEECPLSRTPYMGSLHYFKSLTEEEKKRSYVIAFDAIGYYSEIEKSQNLKLPILAKQYSNKGNFITFVGKSKSLESLQPERFLINAIRSFDQASIMRSEILNAPIGVYGVHNEGCEDDMKTILLGNIKALVLREAGHSDHWSAWKEGINPAIMITDTAMARNPHYHKASDTYETINYTYLTRLVQGLTYMIKSLDANNMPQL